MTTAAVDPDFLEKKRSRERSNVLRQIRTGALKPLRSKVATILSEIPLTRDCDLQLTIELLSRFYPEFIENDSVKLRDLFELPKHYDIARQRAYLQNSLGLFHASPEVRERRLRMAEKKRGEFGQFSTASTEKTLHIYCDESGKGDVYLLAAAFCFVQIGDEVPVGFEKTKSDLGITDEIKFSKMSKNNRERYLDFLQCIFASCGAWSARGLYLKNSSAHTHSKEEKIWEVLQFLVTDIIVSEIESERLIPPFSICLLKDADPNQDSIRLKHYEENLRDALRKHPETSGIEIKTLAAGDSKQVAALQAADLITGAFNNLKNRDSKPSEEKLRASQEILELIKFKSESESGDNVSLRDYTQARKSVSPLTSKLSHVSKNTNH